MKVSLIVHYSLKLRWIIPLPFVSNIASNKFSTTSIKMKLSYNPSLAPDVENTPKSFVSRMGVVSRDFAELRVI